jgi:F0F1-type ATP synthase membrane subunit b/b'
MDMNMEQILDAIEDIVDEAKPMPFSMGRITVDGDQLRDYIQDARAALPQELKMSKRILEDREAIIAGAKKEAEAIVRKAEERAKILVSDSEITQKARQQGIELITQAQKQTKMLRDSAYDYINSILSESETALNASLAEVKRTHAALRSKNGGMGR